ncbi:MAG: hypothetical protein ACK5PB_19020 [Pirellula sp.]|jgi:hypothetical protein
MRNKGSRNTLIRIDYDTIGRMAGVSGDTAKQHRNRGEYDPRNLDNLLQWVNVRRTVRGLPMIGVPPKNGTVAKDYYSGVSVPLPYENRVFYYDPLIAGYRSDGSMGGTMFTR